MPMSMRLGEYLLSQGVISKDQLEMALQEQRHRPARLGQILLAMELISEAVFTKHLAQWLGVTAVDLACQLPQQKALERIPVALARQHQVLPLRCTEQQLQLAVTDTRNLPALDEVQHMLGHQLELDLLLASEQQMRQAIDRFYGYEISIDGIVEELGAMQSPELIVTTSDEYSQPFVRLVDAILTDAVGAGASDIHFAPEAHYLRLRYRIDGVLQQIRLFHRQWWSAICVRLKVMAGLDIAETRAPQDGHIRRSIGGHVIDFRVALHPVNQGENLVLRVLRSHVGHLGISQLGLADTVQQTLQKMLLRPEGMLLVCGPTGTGKTTTLYALMEQFNTQHYNIMTLEDPVEYACEGIRQTSVNDAVKLDFSSGVRSILRQDPDVILIGEIRDRETADMAVRSAMTGHRVFSTLHAWSAPGAVIRLMEIGVSRELLAGTLTGVLAQRLLRLLCSKCKFSRRATAQELVLLGRAETDEYLLFDAKGCAACQQRGYLGRKLIVEIFEIDTLAERMITDGRSASELLAYASAQEGFLSLAKQAKALMQQGLTSLEEVVRVVDLRGE